MIYTITFNPALDYVIQNRNIKIGEINRAEEEHILAGGKGINVSIILKTLGIDTTALGFIAGFVGEEIERKVKKYGIKTDFINIENETSRINVKITTPSEETAIDGKGPFIDLHYIKLLYKKIQMIEDGDMLVLSGSIPKGISKNIYQDICKKVEQKNVKVIVDATGELLSNTLKYQPFLIKPNQYELGEIFNVKISDQEEAIKYAKKLQIKGAKNVLVSMGSMGAVLLDENGYSYKMKSLDGEKRMNTVGAGDSMIAGFIAGYELFNNYEKALQMGIAAATATAQSMYLATKEEIYKFLT
ncbi:MAG: 1-phosphofructokinase [Clostridia bacterium]|nr:1-phosphofructokinase [Clostridia bacterium]